MTSTTMQDGKITPVIKYRHAGRYPKKQSAEAYKKILESEGRVVEIKEVTVYDVWVTERPNTLENNTCE